MAASGEPEAGIRGRSSSMEAPPKVSDLRLVLVGRTGAGKSSSGNTILGREAFRAATRHSSETTECSKQREEVFSRMVSVVDTPGLCDTSQSEEMVKREISKCINMSTPGPHAILLVIRFGPFSVEQRAAVMKVMNIFGEEVWKYTIILFTHGDEVNSDFDKMMNDAPAELKEILEKVENRYHVFDNTNANNRQQVSELLEKVQKIVDDNGGEFYSNDDYQNAEEMLDQREKELRQFYEKKLEEDIEAVKAKYEKLLREAGEEKLVKERLESELKEMKRFYYVLGKEARSVIEQMSKEDDYKSLIKKFHKTLTLN